MSRNSPFLCYFFGAQIFIRAILYAFSISDPHCHPIRSPQVFSNFLLIRPTTLHCVHWTRLEICPKMRKLPNLISCTNLDRQTDKNILSVGLNTRQMVRELVNMRNALGWSVQEMLIVLRTLYWGNVNNNNNILNIQAGATFPPAETSPYYRC